MLLLHGVSKLLLEFMVVKEATVPMYLAKNDAEWLCCKFTCLNCQTESRFFLADRVCRVNSSQKFRKSSLSWILFCQHGLFSNCLQRILYVNLIVNLLLRITSMMSLHIHGHVIRTELQPKVLALQSCLWKQEVTPKSLEKFRLNVKIWKPKLVTYWKHVLSTAGSRLQFCLVQCVGIRILPNFVLSPSQCRKTLEN